MYSRVSLRRSCWHVLSSVLESKAVPTPSSCPSGTERFSLRHSSTSCQAAFADYGAPDKVRV
jgi:hypothetical protein